MIGPQGCGKGTHSMKLTEKFNWKYIPVGELLRKNIRKGTKIGKKAEEYVEDGELVPNELVSKMLEKKLEKIDKGFILDGFPRNLEQAKILDKFAKIDKVVYIDIPKEESIKRLSNRRQCRKCGEIYNLLYKKPEKKGICDKCGGELYQREDDKPEAIKERLDTFEKETKPVIEYYRKKGILEKVDGVGSIEEVNKRIERRLKK